MEKKIIIMILCVVLIITGLHAGEIHEAIKNMDLVKVKKLIQKKPKSVNLTDESKQTPLHLACLGTDLNIIKYLINNGADIEALDAYNRTPFLLMARENGNLNITKYLLSKGVNINAKDKYGSNALELLAWRGFKDSLNSLIKAGADFPTSPYKLNSLLRFSVDKRLEELFDSLIEKGIGLNIKNRQGGTLLHSASASGSIKILQLLLKKGFKINKKDIYAWTPLHYAVEKGNKEVIKILIKKGADINSRTSIGQSPYNIAKEYKYKTGNPMNLLIQNKADKSLAKFPVLKGEYFGQEKPDSIPKLFAPDIVSGHYTLHSTPVFSPDGKEVLWSLQIPPREKGYGSGLILYSKIKNGIWMKPQTPPFKIDKNGDVPFFHPNGKKLYYISSLPLKENEQSGKENIWFLIKKDHKWINPKPLGQSINSIKLHWQFSVDKLGNLYFGDNYAKFKHGYYQKSEKIKDVFKNNSLNIDHPFISVKGDYLIYSKFLQNGNGYDLFFAYKRKDGSWTNGKNLGPKINTRGFEICPIVSSDGKYLFFQRNNIAYWVSAKIINKIRKRR